MQANRMFVFKKENVQEVFTLKVRSSLMNMSALKHAKPQAIAHGEKSKQKF